MNETFPDSEGLAPSDDAIEALAQETNRPIADVRRVFESEFARLKRDARVTDYLVLFASRRARETLVRGTF